ncbi:hypothetical protein P5G51_013510 [Virgibacillus sp. 179-BFC.A HS]|uniref:Uncharacterized protein n=1 Tax=Tigheibacillus jepli TaxID=3035914 RepID=A0ABU5CIU6_9BACI|nr:hypothetical protein [Virgibacillus sp. 179-BFC.A HS]MDY0406273.1 hypothetical protein [Virgibacillus sp. 179-BFC.A HS]
MKAKRFSKRYPISLTLFFTPILQKLAFAADFHDFAIGYEK